MTEPTDHFLQTPAWQRFQEAIGNRALAAEGPGWRWRGYVETGRLSTRCYVPYGPIAHDSAHLDNALASLEHAAHADIVDFVRVEPTGLDADSAAEILRSRGYRRTNYVQPENTWCLDLTVGPDALLAGMQSSNRNRHRNYAKKGMSIRSSTDPADISILWGLLEKLAEDKGITEHPRSYYEAQAQTLMPNGDGRLFIVDHEDVPIAASFVYDSPAVRYYAHTATDQFHRKLQPGTILVSSMIMDASERGQKVFDFVGIAPEGEPNHPWAGFTEFKKSFGGYPVHYAGTWEKGINSAKYAAYRLVRRILD